MNLPPSKWPLTQRYWEEVYRKITAAVALGWGQISMVGSNLTDLQTRNHADLQNINTASYTHLTATNATDLTDGGATTLHKHDHAVQDNLNSTTYTHLTAANHTDLTDGGATTLHKHDHGGLDGLGDDDHTQYYNETRGDLRYAPIAKGVTNGDTHDHTGGDGAQIDHGELAGLADDDHPQYNNSALAVYAAGTVYSLTTTPAKLNFGTTDPVITIDKAGTYLIRARAQVARNNSSHVGDHTITFNLRRTNNTPADIANSATTYNDEAHAGSNETEPNQILPEVLYTTANTDDVIELWGVVSSAGTGGNHDVDEASIVCTRLY